MTRAPIPETAPSPVPDAGEAPAGRTTLATIGAGLLVTVAVFGGTALLLLTAPSLGPWATTFIVAAATVHALAMLAVIRHFLRRGGITLAALGFSRPTWRLLHLLWQIPVIIIAVLATQGLVFAATGSDPGGSPGGIDSLATSGGPPVAALLFVAVAGLTPLWEEMLFRGMIQGSVRARFGRVAGVAISALAFAAAHGVPILLPYMLTLGCGLALLREFHRNLWGPLAMHCTLNAVASSAILTALL
ncbi:MAG: CPBP family intramembrane glutamic endopeptidase [Arthrobacter sp.]|uniref:CPBP family intramembrane glutamic endopeptidase n=1 Tax=Arthrobacter sp. TaxID=1667 RepID=UPI00347B0F14